MKNPLKHANIPGAGAKARRNIPCDLKFGVVMREFYRGTLFSGAKRLVTSPLQAKAIAYSETRKCKAKRGK